MMPRVLVRLQRLSTRLQRRMWTLCQEKHMSHRFWLVTTRTQKAFPTSVLLPRVGSGGCRVCIRLHPHRVWLRNQEAEPALFMGAEGQGTGHGRVPTSTSPGRATTWWPI